MGAALWPAKTVLVACGFEGVGVKGWPPLTGQSFLPWFHLIKAEENGFPALHFDQSCREWT